MFQNLVNLKSTPSSHADRSLPGSTQEKAAAGFGRLLSDARSALKKGSSEDQEAQSVAAKPNSNIQFADAPVSHIGMADPALGIANSKAIMTKEKLAELLSQDKAASALQPETVSGDTLAAEAPELDNGELGAMDVTMLENGDLEADSREAPLELNNTAKVLSGFEMAADRLSMAGNPAAQAGADIARTRSPVKSVPDIPTVIASNPGETTNSKPGPLVSEFVSSRIAGNGQSLTSVNTVPLGTVSNEMVTTRAAVGLQKSSGKSDKTQVAAPEMLKQMPAAALKTEATTLRSNIDLQAVSANQRSEVVAHMRGSGSNQENSAMPMPTVDAASVKPVNDLSLNTLGQPSQTLITAIKENTNWTRMLSAPSVHFTESVKPNGKVLQALNVTLNPVDLGKLELNLRMHQGQVTIEVRTGTDQAYRALLVDQDSLVNNLRSLGFKVDGITINGPQTDNTSQFQSTAQSEYGGSASKSDSETSRRDRRLAEDEGRSATDMTISDEENTATHNII